MATISLITTKTANTNANTIWHIIDHCIKCINQHHNAAVILFITPLGSVITKP